MKNWKIGLFGLGTVGQGLLSILQEMQNTLPARTGASFEITAIVDRSFQKKKYISGTIATSDQPDLILKDNSIDIVVELMGGLEPAGGIIKAALNSGKHVVTANKALLAKDALALFSLAREKQKHLAFEAAVAGALPVIKNMRRGIVANQITGLYGILNGTCNYIITRMQLEGLSYADSLRSAQEKGFAEADPSFDVNGSDAAQKLALLASLAFDAIIHEDQVIARGIVGLDAIDLKMASSYGYCIRLLAVARQTADGLLLRVHPALIHNDHTLASVFYEKNAVFFESNNSGPLLITGSGAGARPTAAAVISDLVAIANSARPESWPLTALQAGRPLNQGAEYEFYLRFQTVDRPGVLAHISKVLADHQISIASMQQPSGKEPVNVVLLTHRAPESALMKAVTEIAAVDLIQAKPVLLPVESNV